MYLKKLSKHLNHKEVKEKILDEYPAPLNIKSVPDLDVYVKELLKEDNKFDCLHMDKVLKEGPRKRSFCLRATMCHLVLAR